MNQAIVKTFMGKHIDLSKVVSISDAEFFDRMGFGGYFVGFEMEVQLLDKPIKYERKLTYEERQQYEENHKKLPYGLQVSTSQSILAVRNLQKQINELIQQWKEI